VLRHQQGVTITELSTATVITVDAPEPGIWHLSVAGSGEFTATAQANSPIQPFTFEFGALVTEPLDLGFVPIPGQPVVDVPLVAGASLIGPLQRQSSV
jgi:hypothetical protein